MIKAVVSARLAWKTSTCPRSLTVVQKAKAGRFCWCGLIHLSRRKDAAGMRRRAGGRVSGVVSLRCGRRISSGSGESTGPKKHEKKQHGDPRAPPQARSRRPAGPSPAVDLMWVRPSAAPSMSWFECKLTRFPSQQSFLFMTNPTQTQRPSPTPAVNTKDLRYHNRDHQIPDRLAGRSNRPNTKPCFSTSHTARSGEMT